ncbi:MAG: hypothetical protein HS118_08260 [Bacteroidia bacterium]|nr:hypothetical protein [Bacteroidia bacterium]
MRKIYHTVSLLLITAGVLRAQVNVTVTAPAKVGACIENQYTLSFSGAPALTQLVITPSLNVTAGGSCPATNGIAIQFVIATNATLIADGSSLTVEVSNTGSTTISYYVLIDCHFADSSSVNPSQTLQAITALTF